MYIKVASRVDSSNGLNDSFWVTCDLCVTYSINRTYLSDSQFRLRVAANCNWSYYKGVLDIGEKWMNLVNLHICDLVISNQHSNFTA